MMIIITKQIKNVSFRSLMFFKSRLFYSKFSTFLYSETVFYQYPSTSKLRVNPRDTKLNFFFLLIIKTYKRVI